MGDAGGLKEEGEGAKEKVVASGFSWDLLRRRGVDSEVAAEVEGMMGEEWWVGNGREVSWWWGVDSSGCWTVDCGRTSGTRDYFAAELRAVVLEVEAVVGT